MKQHIDLRLWTKEKKEFQLEKKTEKRRSRDVDIARVILISYLGAGLLDALLHRYGNSFQQLLQLQLFLLRQVIISIFKLKNVHVIFTFFVISSLKSDLPLSQ